MFFIRKSKRPVRILRGPAAPLMRAIFSWAWRALLVLGVVCMIAVASLRWIDPATTAVIWAENRGENKNIPPAQIRWRDLDEISKQFATAVIAAEDQRFFDHYGLDFVEVHASLSSRHGRLRGASTISQQVAKNLFLWRGRSYLRKLLEAPLAIYIDFVWGKRRVLEMYLNVVQFGAQIYGAENAAQHFFNKPASRVTRYEAARLASVLPNPKARSPTQSNADMRRRWRWILRQMRAIGGVSILRRL